MFKWAIRSNNMPSRWHFYRKKVKKTAESRQCKCEYHNPSQCDCVYHRDASEQKCDCVYHTDASERKCACEYHAEAFALFNSANSGISCDLESSTNGQSDPEFNLDDNDERLPAAAEQLVDGNGFHDVPVKNIHSSNLCYTGNTYSQATEQSESGRPLFQGSLQIGGVSVEEFAFASSNEEMDEKPARATSTPQSPASLQSSEPSVPADDHHSPNLRRLSAHSLDLSIEDNGSSTDSTDADSIQFKAKESHVSSTAWVYFAMDEEQVEPLSTSQSPSGSPLSSPPTSPPSSASWSSEPEDGHDSPNPSSSSSSESSSDYSSEDSSSEDDGDAFNINAPRMFDVLQFHEDCTKKEAMAVVISHAMRHSLDYIGIINLFTSMNTILGRRYFPCTKRKLWRDLNKKSAGSVKRALCGNCGLYIGQLLKIKRRRRRIVVCRHCHSPNHVKKLKYFITLSLKKQLQNFLDTAGSAELLRYRDVRRKICVGGLEDIFDGRAYKELQEEGEPLASNYNYSFSFNSDGAKMSQAGANSIHLLFIRINELHPRMRQNLVFLAAVHIGEHEPNCQLFYKWFVEEANELSTDGLVWRPHGEQEIRSKFVPTLCIVDAKERCRILNQPQHNGHHSCTFCTHPGVSIPDGPCKFPLPGTEVFTGRQARLFVVPECERRSEQTMRQHLMEANAVGEIVQGMKPGLSPVFGLQGFKMCDNCSPDDLHPIYEGVVKFHTKLLIAQCNLNEARQAIVTNRMKGVKFPRNISRQKMDLSQRAKWKGSQWRTWLLYLAVPCLQNLQGFEYRYVAHLELLSHAIYLLSRDIITEDDLETAERYLQRYVALFQNNFGPENMRFNVHMLLHLPEAVARWGNLWSQSTFGFESWIMKAKRRVKSPTSAVDQIVDRYLLDALVERLPHDNDLSERIRSQLLCMWQNSKLHQHAQKVGDVYLLGRGEERMLTEDEGRILLEHHGYEVEEVIEFKSISMPNRIMCHCIGDNDFKCDDSTVYTYSDMFCSIKNIALLNVRGRDEVGLFVDILDTGDCIGSAHHIVQQDEGDSVPGYISISSVRSIALKVTVGNVLYMSPVANHMEID